MTKKYMYIGGALAVVLVVGAFYFGSKQQTEGDHLVPPLESPLAASFVTVNYACAEGKTVTAKIEVTPEGVGHAEVLLSDGRDMLLAQTVSASGVRYANTDDTFIFWNKGNTAFIEEGSLTTFSDCVAQQ